MRACLTFLVFAALLVGLIAWVGLPVLAAGAIDVGLGLAGFHGDHTSVDVRADPPLELVLGRANGVTVRSEAVTSGPLTAENLNLTLTDVGLFDRSASDVSGTLTGVVFHAEDGSVVNVSRIELDGPLEAARARLTIPAAEVRTHVQAALAAAGITAGDITPQPPDSLLVTVLGRQARAVLGIDAAGRIGLVVPGIATVGVVEPPAGLGVRFTSVSVAADRSLLVDGTIDLSSLLRGSARG